MPRKIPKKDIEFYAKFFEENNVSCIFNIPGVGSGTYAKDKTDLLVLVDLAKAKIEYLELENIREAKAMIEEQMKSKELKEFKKTQMYMG